MNRSLPSTKPRLWHALHALDAFGLLWMPMNALDALDALDAFGCLCMPLDVYKEFAGQLKGCEVM